MFYLIILSNEHLIDVNLLKKKLNLAMNWVQIMPNVFIVKSYKSMQIWRLRIKTICNDNMFFITKLDLKSNDYSGYLYKSTWEWINSQKKRL